MSCVVRFEGGKTATNTRVDAAVIHNLSCRPYHQVNLVNLQIMDPIETVIREVRPVCLAKLAVPAHAPTACAPPIVHDVLNIARR